VNGVFVGAGHIGLGYDSVAKKHMLVRLAYGENHSECKVRYVGDYSWYTVDSPPPRWVDGAAPPVFANGRLYWIADSKAEPRSPRCEIMAFDVLMASFEVLNGPPCGDLVDDGGERTVSVLELRGELRAARSNRDANSIEVWAMKDKAMRSLEYHIELERFSPEYSSPEMTALAVDPEDGRILLSTGRVLGYYDTSTPAVETIYRLGSVPSGDRSGYKFTPALCRESLVCPFD
jgi:F-box interacting protein